MTQDAKPKRPRSKPSRTNDDFSLSLAPGRVAPPRPRRKDSPRVDAAILKQADNPSSAEIVSAPPSPFAKHQGVLRLGPTDIDCYVLDTGYRVLSLRASVHALSGSLHSGDLEGYINVAALRTISAQRRGDLYQVGRAV